MTVQNIQLWEVFIRSRNGLAHKHVGSLHATDAALALQAARDIYTRRGEGVSLWVVPSSAIVASSPDEQDPFFEANRRFHEIIAQSSGNALFDQSVEDRLRQLQDDGTKVPDPPPEIAHRYLGKTISLRFKGK